MTAPSLESLITEALAVVEDTLHDVLTDDHTWNVMRAQRIAERLAGRVVLIDDLEQVASWDGSYIKHTRMDDCDAVPKCEPVYRIKKDARTE
jgi:hypothetical protein